MTQDQIAGRGVPKENVLELFHIEQFAPDAKTPGYWVVTRTGPKLEKDLTRFPSALDVARYLESHITDMERPPELEIRLGGATVGHVALTTPGGARYTWRSIANQIARMVGFPESEVGRLESAIVKEDRERHELDEASRVSDGELYARFPKLRRDREQARQSLVNEKRRQHIEAKQRAKEQAEAKRKTKVEAAMSTLGMSVEQAAKVLS